jgi:hypothetical protein
MWPYNRFGRPPMAPPAFTAIPQSGDNFYSNPGGAYGPPPPQYGGAAPPPPVLLTYQAPSASPWSTPWNPTHGGSWNQDSLAHSFNTMTLNPPAPSSEWYADSGVGSHMTADTGNLSSISPPSSFTPSSIIVGNGAQLPIIATGSHIFSFLHRNLVLNDVLVSPNIIKNLISIRRFTTDNNCSIEFDPFGLSVKDLHTRNVIVRCNSSGDLYPFYPPSISTSAFITAPTSLWHCCFGHLGHEALSKLISSVPFLAIRMISTTYVMHARWVVMFVSRLDHLALELFIILI